MRSGWTRSTADRAAAPSTRSVDSPRSGAPSIDACLLSTSSACSARKNKRSGCEAFATPRSTRLRQIAEPIVQAARASLPELELVRNNAVSTPPFRPWHVIVELLTRGVEQQLQCVSTVDNLALLRRVDTPAAFDWTAREVGIGLGSRDLLHRAVNTDLPFEAAPGKQQAGAAGGLHLARLAALIIR